MTKIDQFAQDFAVAVRNAFNKLHHFSPSQAADQSVWPSWSDKGIKTNWEKPNPRVVIVNTEHGWIQDPWSNDEAHRLWDTVTQDLARAGWGNVHWDSINAAIHIVFIDLPDEWIDITMKRAFKKGS